MAAAPKPSPPADATPDAVLTIGDVITRVVAHPELEPARRADLASALRTMCRALKTEPECLVANLRQISKRLAGVSPASIGVSPGRWSNVRNLTLAALRLVGIRALPGRYRDSLSPEWEALRAELKTDEAKRRLSRFMGFSSANGIKPGAVTPETFARFKSEIENNSLVRRPTAVVRDTYLTWNKAANDVPGWPQLRVEVPNRRRDFAYPEESFPESFRRQVDVYQSNRANPDVFSKGYCRPLSDITLKQRRQHIFLLATALVASGYPIEKLTALSVLVKPANAEAALRFLFERSGSKHTPFIARLAILLVTIAKHHVGLKERQVDQLRGFARNLRPESKGFTEKNRAFVRQLADPRKLRALLCLPDELLHRAESGIASGRCAAVRVEMAVAISLEFVIPLRMDDLTGLRADRHLDCQGETVTISVTAKKNGCIVDAELPANAVRLLNLYRRNYRPRLAGADSPWLFPGKKGGRRQTGGFGSQLSRLIYRETGIRMTPHQFRHLAAKLYLDAHPGDFETVRRLLGHKNVATTIRFYQELDKLMASRRYNEIVTRLVAEQGFVVPPAPGGR